MTIAEAGGGGDGNGDGDGKESAASSAAAQRQQQERMKSGRTIAESFFAGGGLRKMVLNDDEQAALVGAIAKHLAVLRQIPEFLPHLHVDSSAVRVAPSGVCDGRGVFATRDIKAHTLVTLYPASNELSLCANRVRGNTSVWRSETYKARGLTRGREARREGGKRG